MSKRPSETSLMAPTEKKCKITTTEQVVLMKREFKKNEIQKEAARVNNNVIYKLDCKTLNKKEQNLVYVDTKEMYDKIEKDCSYKFTIERRDNKRWYLLNYEKLDSEEVVLKEILTDEDFVNELESFVNFYVEGAYNYNDDECIKIFGYVKIDDGYKQCDLIVKLDGPSCFNFESHQTKAAKCKKALTKIYTCLLNKWWVFRVYCCKTRNLNYNMLVRDNSGIEESNIDETITGPLKNVSYNTQKTFKLIEIVNICKSELIEKSDNLSMRIEIEMLSKNDVLLFGTKFLTNNQLEEAHEIVSDISSLNFEIEIGARVFCIYSHKLNMSLPYNYVIAMVNIDEDNEATSVFSG
ncbi:lef-3 [Matsumuraeses phaseoli granulovirus]|uniref:Lef-3 n=1 Tax=Matsumuraeses phaseoli granulovirus TaxID=2760664 RepID=A0AAE7MLG3_9BBAC|nr:lef-3 [Matsumuraeses phaseoli granulovirus]QOD40065.1 lef-3 [Matsumuraeses phaseoli granulovirus]